MMFASTPTNTRVYSKIFMPLSHSYTLKLCKTKRTSKTSHLLTHSLLIPQCEIDRFLTVDIIYRFPK